MLWNIISAHYITPILYLHSHLILSKKTSVLLEVNHSHMKLWVLIQKSRRIYPKKKKTKENLKKVANSPSGEGPKTQIPALVRTCLPGVRNLAAKFQFYLFKNRKKYLYTQSQTQKKLSLSLKSPCRSVSTILGLLNRIAYEIITPRFCDYNGRCHCRCDLTLTPLVGMGPHIHSWHLTLCVSLSPNSQESDYIWQQSIIYFSSGFFEKSLVKRIFTIIVLFKPLSCSTRTRVCPVQSSSPNSFFFF